MGKCNSIKEYEGVLVRMRGERDKYNKITKDTDNQSEGEL